jgi:hypothetical protein
MNDTYWDGFDIDLPPAKRDNASNANKLRYIAARLPSVYTDYPLGKSLVRMVHEVAGDLETASKNNAGEFSSVAAARKSLNQLRLDVMQVTLDINRTIKQSSEYKTLRRQFGVAQRATTRERARYEATVKEAQRQAARAKEAEQALDDLRADTMRDVPLYPRKGTPGDTIRHLAGEVMKYAGDNHDLVGIVAALRTAAADVDSLSQSDDAR